MWYALFSLLLATSGVALTQNHPQLTWQGYVSGSATLYIQGDRVDVQGRDTGSVDQPAVNMIEPLPAARQSVQLDVRRGRGRVQVVEQPTPRNEFSAIVRIDPVGTRHELYVIDFFWDPAGGSRTQSRRNRDYGTRGRTIDRSAGPGEMTWSGTVDHEAVIEVRGQRVNVRTLQGRPVSGQPSFSAALPRQTVSVRLEQAQGRGQVELVEQPGPDNNYAALVRILDEEGGAGQYGFRLVWEDGYEADRTDPYTPNRGGILTPQGRTGGYTPDGRGMPWSGRVV
jgi:hypothetical protein